MADPLHAALPAALATLEQGVYGLPAGTATELVVESLMRPVHLLELLASDSEAALVNNAVARERMVLTLFASQAYAPLAAAFDDVRGAQPWAPALLDPAALTIVGLAAGRCGRSRAEAMQNVRVVAGLVAAAALPEALAGVQPRSLDGRGLESVLRALAAGGAMAARPSAELISTFAQLPGELARRSLLAVVFADDDGVVPRLTEAAWVQSTTGFAAVNQFSLRSRWEGAVGGALLASAQADTDGVRVSVRDFGTAPLAPVEGVVVLADTAGVTVTSEEPIESARELRVQAGALAGPAWAGVSIDAWVADSQAFRAGVRQALAELAATWVLDDPSPRVADYPALAGRPGLAVADREAHLRFELPEAQAVPVDPPPPPLALLGVAWNVDASELVDRSPELSLNVTWAPARAATVALEDRHRVTLVVGAGTQGSLTLRVPRARALERGMRVVLSEDEKPAATLPVPPADRSTRATLRVVVFRPVLAAVEEGDAGPRMDVQRVALDALPNTLPERDGVQVSVQVVEPGVVPDSVGVLSAPLAASADARIGPILDALAALAGEAPGFEDAVWAAVVPGEGVLRWDGAACARAVAVVSVDRWAELAAAIAKARSPDPTLTDRLVVTGRIASNLLLVDSTRADVRAAGTAPSRVVAAELVLRDAGGQELQRVPVRVARRERPCGFVLSVPVPPAVRRVELRDRTGRVHWWADRASRPVDLVPEVGALEVGARLWSLGSRSPVPRRMELVAMSGETGPSLPLGRIDPCKGLPRVPLSHLRPGGEVAIMASVGWEVTFLRSIARASGGPALAIRPIDATTWFADVEGTPDAITWTLDGAEPQGATLIETGTGPRAIRFSGPPASGLLRVEVSMGGQSVEDTVQLGAPA